MKTTRYYSALRPVGPGTWPKGYANAVEVTNFDKPVYFAQLGRTVWGWIEFDRPISDALAADYDLIPDPLREARK